MLQSRCSRRNELLPAAKGPVSIPQSSFLPYTLLLNCFCSLAQQRGVARSNMGRGRRVWFQLVLPLSLSLFLARRPRGYSWILMEDPRLKSRAARISKGSKSSQDQQPQTPQGGSSSHAHQAFTPNQQNLSHAYFPPPPPMTPPTFIPPPLPPGVQLPPDFYQPIRASTDGAISGYAMPPPPQILTPPPTSTWRPHPFLPWAMGIPNQLNFQPRPVGIGDPRLVPRMGMNLCHQSPVFISHTHLGGVAPIQPLNKPVDPFVESWLKEVAQRRDSQAQNHDKKDSKEQESLKVSII